MPTKFSQSSIRREIGGFGIKPFINGPKPPNFSFIFPNFHELRKVSGFEIAGLK